MFTDYVYFQQHVIRVLFKVLKSHPDVLGNMIFSSKGLTGSLLHVDRQFLVANGLQVPVVPKELWDVEKDLLEIVKEQVDDTGPEIRIRNLLGMPLFNQGYTENLKTFLKRGGGFPNILRTKHIAHPGTLKVGDVLGNGDKVISPPREGGNGAVLVHIESGERGTWLSFPACTPLALMCDEYLKEE